MKLTNEKLTEKLWLLGQEYLHAYKDKYTHNPVTEKSIDWPSPCEKEAFNETEVTWQPVSISDKLNFSNVEHALGLSLHSDITTFYTTMFSENIPASCNEGNFSLLFAWNNDDFERLQENIIGHILMKKKLKQDLTVFFAVTDEEDAFLSINNDTGEVWVESVGCEPHKKIADSLSHFIDTIKPIA